MGATTRIGLLSGPFRDRFGLAHRIDFYQPHDLEQIIQRAASVLGIAIDQPAARELGRRSRGTPRIANRLLKRVRDLAEVSGRPHIDLETAHQALTMHEVDELGLDSNDRRYLLALADKFDGGPVGIETMAASLAEDTGTLEDVVEPYLLQQGLIARTPRGRVLTANGYNHLGLAPKTLV